MDLCKLTKLGTIGAVAALLAASGTAALGQTAVRARAQGQPAGEVSAHSMTFQTTKDGRNVVVEMRNDEVVKATIDGEDVPKDRIKERGGKLVIVDEDGRTVFEMNRGGRGNTWVVGPNQRLFGPGWQDAEQLAPADPPPVMMGVTLAEPDRGLRNHFGLEEGKATMLQAVYDGLPAAKAGLKAYDIVVAINGDEDAGQNQLREALRDADEGDTITLGVIQNGQRKQVKVKLEKYDQERLADAARKYREEHGDEESVFQFGFPFGGGQGEERQWVVPGTPSLPDDFAERFREHFQGQQGQRLRELQEEQSKRAKELREQLQRAPRARAGGDEDKLDRLENRLDRLERMLEKLADQQESKKGKAGG